VCRPHLPASAPSPQPLGRSRARADDGRSWLATPSLKANASSDGEPRAEEMLGQECFPGGASGSGGQGAHEDPRTLRDPIAGSERMEVCSLAVVMCAEFPRKPADPDCYRLAVGEGRTSLNSSGRIYQCEPSA